jgi:hypothetical protein
MEELEKKIEKFKYHITPNWLFDKGENIFLAHHKNLKNDQEHIINSWNTYIY